MGLNRLGKEVGSIHRSKMEPKLDPLVERFIEHGRSLGWKKNTLRLHLRTLQQLKEYLALHHGLWPEPRLQDVDDFLAAASKRWKRTTVAAAAGTVRAWLRFLFLTGYSPRSIAESVALPPHIRYARPPRSVPWRIVRQLRSGIDPRTAIGRRDMAQYLLFCAYGLSNAEVTNLKLEDIDWHAGILHIRRLNTFAVHRLQRWYREGQDPAPLLPWLSAYLGHVDLLGTQRYLRTAPEILGESSQPMRRGIGFNPSEP